MEFFVFDNNFAIKYKIQDIKSVQGNKGPNHVSIKIFETGRYGIDKSVYKSLFSNNVYLIADKKTVQRWISIGEKLYNERIILNVKAKQDSYIRFIFHQACNNIFIESYIQWYEWLKIQDDLLSLKDEINICIKNFEVSHLGELKNIIKNLIYDLFKKLSLPVSVLDSSRLNLIDFYIGGKPIYLPLEIFNPVIVNYYIPSSFQESTVSNHFTIIYSTKISDYTCEINVLKEVLDKHFNVEILSGENYENYKFNTRNSSYIHYSGHGKIFSDKGMIELNNKYTDRIFYTDRVRLAFLNCCNTGLTTDGIIGNLIDSGTDYVIATPYEISAGTGDDYKGLIDFYSFLTNGDIKTSFILNSIKNPDFSLYYRLFGRYCTKI